MSRGPARRAALLLVGSAALIGAGCGSSAGSTSVGLRVQREDLVVTAKALAGAEAEVEAETRATRPAWPSVVDGLPHHAGTATRARIREANLKAAALKLPEPFTEERSRSLSGPAAGLAGTYRGYEKLASTGWRMIDYSLGQLERGSAAAASFAKSNAALYIESVYDAHFSAAHIGERLLAGYEHLGGGAAFGSSLTQAEAEQLAAFYSEARLRLHPHAGVRLGS